MIHPLNSGGVTMNPQASGYLSVVISALLFGAIGILNRWIQLNAIVQSDCRFLLSALLLAILFKDARKVPERKDLRVFIGMSAGLAGAGSLFAFSVKFIPVGTAGMCYQALPVFAVIMSRIKFKEKISISIIGSIGLALIGTFLLAPEATWKFAGADARGVCFAISAAFMGAIMMTNMQALPTAYTPVQCSMWMNVGAGLFLLPAPFVVRNQSYSMPTFGLLVILSLVAGLGGCFLTAGTKRIGSTRASIILYLEPLATVVYAVLIFGERMTWRNGLGALLVISAGLLISWSMAKTKPAPEIP